MELRLSLQLYPTKNLLRAVFQRICPRDSVSDGIIPQIDLGSHILGVEESSELMFTK